MFKLEFIIGAATLGLHSDVAILSILNSSFTQLVVEKIRNIKKQKK
jgi:hypothetical protein